MRCVFESVYPLKNKNSASLFYLNGSLKKEIVGFQKKYNEIFKYKVSPNVHDVIGKLTDFNLIKTSGYCGGYYDLFNKEIAYNATLSDNLDFTILHELGHHIQVISNNWHENNHSLSDELKFERQATTVSFYLYNLIFKKKAPHHFRSYFNSGSAQFLKEYYDGSKWYLEDDLKEGLK